MGDELPDLIPGQHLVGDRPLDLSTFEGRAYAVAALGGKLTQHRCCPRCGDQSPVLATIMAFCDLCGWAGLITDLIDTVQSGATKIPGA